MANPIRLFADPGLEVFVIQIRTPSVEDGAAIWELVRGAGSLDLNSPYAYLLFADYFRDSCVVACDGDRLAGAIIGLTPPGRDDTVFVWQIGVDSNYRGRQVGRRMLAWLVQHARQTGATYLEATVTPTNEPSLRMFRGFARDTGAPCEESLRYPTTAFPHTGEGHEEEWLLRIGPIPRETLANLNKEHVATTGGHAR